MFNAVKATDVLTEGLAETVGILTEGWLKQTEFSKNFAEVSEI